MTALKMADLRITEQSNVLTSNIDVCDTIGVLRLLRQSDAQLFAGFGPFPGLCDEETQLKISQIAFLMRDVMFTANDRPSAVVFSGCGTSGRLACFCAEEFARVYESSKSEPNSEICGNCEFHYLIAGGDRALVRAVENAEDDPNLAVLDLAQFVSDPQAYHRILYIGITCGLSAPYVFAQIQHLSRFSNTTGVLLGFNPLVPDAVSDLVEQNKIILLNPVVGPEPITGSTRMKGGSATKIILETIFYRALVRRNIATMLRYYEEACRKVYLSIELLQHVVNAAAHSLRSGGHVYYIGRENYGILGFIDASECVPTYGASFDDVRGFKIGGWRSLPETTPDQLPPVSSFDTVIFLDPQTAELYTPKLPAGKKAYTIHVTSSEVPDLSASVCVWGVHQSFARELAMKLVLNAVTTGAHVLRGMTFGNRMINVRVSNMKLFYRAVRIISDVACVDEAVAQDALFRSLYLVDAVPADIPAKPVAEHVSQATTREKVVPLAILLCYNRTLHVADGNRLLEGDPIIRHLLNKYSSTTDCV
eukprot:ANDGO_03845.mRNA.1 N-acetylmuramic acid 6-phosphate etherase